MAITNTYGDAWQCARPQSPVSNENTIWSFATNAAVSKMWLGYDWRGTVQPLPPFWTVPAQQDYGAPLYSVPSDFYGLRETYLVQVGSTSVPLPSPINVVENLQQTGACGLPSSICYRPSIAGFRLFPCASFGAASPLYMIQGTYKTRPPKVTRALSDQLILWDDVYFETFVQFLAWAALAMSGQRKAALDQLQVAKMSLMESTASENLELGEPTVHPGEGLMMPTSYGGWSLGYW